MELLFINPFNKTQERQTPRVIIMISWNRVKPDLSFGLNS